MSTDDRLFQFDLPDDKEEYAGGGFNEVMGDAEPTPTPEPEIEPEKEPEAKDPEPEKEPEPEEKPEPKKDFTLRLKEQYDFMTSQIARMQQELLATKAELAASKATEAGVELPTEDDWVNNPTAAAQRTYEVQIAKQRQEEAAAAKQALRSKQQEAVMQLKGAAPQIFNDPALFQELDSIYQSDPRFFNDPEGPIKAANEMIERRKRLGITPRQNTATREAEEKAAQNERARAEKVKQGAMHGSGKGAQSKVITLDPKLEAYARKLGANIDTLKKIRGAK